MRKTGLFLALLALSACLAQALPLGTVPRAWDRDGDPYAGAPGAPGRNQEDSVLADVHANSCYISTVRALDFDPAANAMNLIFRGTDGNLYNLTSLDHGSSYLRQGPLVSGSVRYPSGMCDLANQLPFAFFNRGWSAGDEGAYVTWDDLGYGGELWATPVPIDTIGQGTAGAALYVVNGVAGSSGRIHACGNYWGDYTPDAAFYYYSDDNGYTWSGRFLVYYDLHGTEDSLALFGGGPVVHDSVAEGYVNQLQIFASPSGGHGDDRHLRRARQRGRDRHHHVVLLPDVVRQRGQLDAADLGAVRRAAGLAVNELRRGHRGGQGGLPALRHLAVHGYHGGRWLRAEHRAGGLPPDGLGLGEDPDPRHRGGRDVLPQLRQL